MRSLHWISAIGLSFLVSAAASSTPPNPPPQVGTAFCFGTVCPCGNLDTVTGGGCANTTGVGGLLRGLGGTSVSADDLVFEASQLPVAKVTLLIACRSVRDNKFGDGRLCIGPQMSRMWGHENSNQDGMVVRQNVISTLVAYGTPMAAGETWNFQLWYRDPSPTWGCTAPKPVNHTNVTNAYAVTLTP